MFNNKGQTTGELVLIFIGIIVGLALFVQIIDTQNQVTEKQAVTDESDDLGTSCYVYNLSGTATATWEVNESDSDCNITVDKWYDSDDWRASEGQCNIGSVVVTNSSGALTLTEGTDYNLYAGTGIIQMLNTENTNSSLIQDNTTAIDYNYCAEGYNKDASSRSIAGLWGLFAALIIAGAAIYGIRRWF